MKLKFEFSVEEVLQPLISWVLRLLLVEERKPQSSQSDRVSESRRQKSADPKYVRTQTDVTKVNHVFGPSRIDLGLGPPVQGEQQ